eukprot:RCo043725
MGLLVVLAVVAVGLLAFLPVYFRSEATISTVTGKFRELSFLAVEDNVVNLLQAQVRLVKLLAKEQASLPQGDLFAEELRKLLFFGIQSMEETTGFGVGYACGDAVGITRNVVTDTLSWLLSGNVTGHNSAVVPAVTWDDSWLQNLTSAGLGPPYNA